MDGKTFFYPNPLESNGQHARQEWFGVACCPGNITRFMPSVPGYVYATRQNDVFVNLYATGTANIDVPAGRVVVTQATQYPWDGKVKLTVTPESARRFQVHVRIPGWARNEPVPSDLYRFTEQIGDAAASVRVNGTPVVMTTSRGYVTLDRLWNAGDVIDMDMPMPVRRVESNNQVVANRLRRRVARQPEWQGAQHRAARRESAGHRVSRRSPERRAGDHRTSRRPVARCQGRGAARGTAVHGDPLRDVGEPRARADGGVARAR
jgi:DUF1680 family protein